MPLYDFKCSNCGHEFEELVANPGINPDCSNCGVDAIRDRIVASPAHFKGLPFGNTKHYPKKPKKYSTNKSDAKKRRKMK